MPRHPPCALHSLSQQRQDNTQRNTTDPPPNQRGRPDATDPLKTRKSRQHTHTSNQPTTRYQPRYQPRCDWLQRCSRPLCRSQTTTPPTPSHTTSPQPWTSTRVLGRREEPEDPTTTPPPHKQAREADTADPSGPNSVFNHPPTNVRQTPNPRPEGPGADSRRSTSETPPSHPHIRWASGCVLLRKEVIQPHLPVRLPCYDFVPIASPTFDGSLHKGWATGFGCCRLS